MKKLVVLFVFMVGMGMVQESSDYAIVQRFQATAKQISKAIEASNTVQECNVINRRIEGLKNDYQVYEQLLDNALYPETFNSILNDLRSKLTMRQRDLATIEKQGGQIQELETKIQELTDQIAALTAQNEKLFADVQRLSQNIKRLTGDLFTSSTPLDSLQRLVVQLRKGLQERDALITALIDSIFLQYDKNLEQMSETERKALIAKVEKHGLLSNVKRSLQDNIAFVEITNLKGTDAEEIIKQQRQLQAIWNAVGSKLTTLYATAKQRKVETSTIDSLFVQWNLKINSALWRSLNALFLAKDFQIVEFNNGNEFVASLGAFFEAQASNRDDESKETRYKKFTTFNEEIWIPELQMGWFPTLIKLGHLTESQKAELEDKYSRWKSGVEPASSILPVVLVILVVVALIAVLIWYWKRQNKETEEEEL